MPDLNPFTVAKLAERWDCNVETIHAHINTGRLPAFSIGKPGAKRPTYRITAAAVENFEKGELVEKPAKRSRRRRQRSDVIKFF